MARPCSICSNPNRDAIETLLNGGTPFRNIAARFQVSASATFRHKGHSNPPLAAPTATPGNEHVMDSDNDEESPAGQRLTLRQKLFVEHYLATRNGRESAELAGYTGNDATLRSMAVQNLSLPHIRAEIDRRLRPFILSADEVLTLLSSQAHADIDGLLDKDGRLDLAKARRTGAIRVVKKLKFGKDGKVESLELYDAQAAAVHIGRKHKMFTDKFESDLPPDAQKQLDEIQKIQQEIQEKFGISPESATRIVNDVYGVDSGLASDSLS